MLVVIEFEPDSERRLMTYEDVANSIWVISSSCLKGDEGLQRYLNIMVSRRILGQQCNTLDTWKGTKTS
jgi:hypothetical protein